MAVAIIESVIAGIGTPQWDSRKADTYNDVILLENYFVLLKLPHALPTVPTLDQSCLSSANYHGATAWCQPYFPSSTTRSYHHSHQDYLQSHSLCLCCKQKRKSSLGSFKNTIPMLFQRHPLPTSPFSVGTAARSNPDTPSYKGCISTSPLILQILLQAQ